MGSLAFERKKTKWAIGRVVYVLLKEQAVLITGSEDGYRTLGKYSPLTLKRE
jgi:hypothetical protein